jgi:hypothetical protein
MFPLNTILAWNINIIMNKKYNNNNIIIASRAYFLQRNHLLGRAPRRDFWLEDGDDKRDTLSARQERERGYRFGNEIGGLQAETRARPEWLPGAFSPFFVSFFFSFSVFYFFYRFFKIAPKQFNPIPRIF